MAAASSRTPRTGSDAERLIFTLIGGGFIGIGLVIGVALQTFRGRPKKAGYKF